MKYARAIWDAVKRFFRKLFRFESPSPAGDGTFFSPETTPAVTGEYAYLYREGSALCNMLPVSDFRSNKLRETLDKIMDDIRTHRAEYSKVSQASYILVGQWFASIKPRVTEWFTEYVKPRGGSAFTQPLILPDLDHDAKEGVRILNAIA